MSIGTSLLIVLAGLQVETSTPDSLCPTLKAVQEAVDARVGEVRGGDYLASYRMVRSSGEGGDAIELELRGEGSELLVKRTLPLGELACSDADVAIAHVLERYFQQLTTVAPAKTIPPTESNAGANNADPVAPTSVSVKPAEQPAPVEEAQAKPASRPASEADGASHNASSRWGLTVAAGATLEPAPYFGLNVDFAVTSSWELALGAVIPLSSDKEQLDDTLRIDTYNPAAVLGLRFRHSFSGWSLAGGPIVTASLQWARLAESEDVERETASAQVRVIWGLGAEGLARLALSKRTQLELALRLAPLFPPSRSFTIDESDGSETELPLDPTWFGSFACGARTEF
jgi:hypothetical protein